MTVIMVAPNGGRRSAQAHPGIPMTIAATAATAAAAQAAGAQAIHAHLRDAEREHLLDVGAYRELIAEIGTQAPGLAVQVTTEAIGRYSPQEQMALVRALRPEFASVALRELAPAGDAALDFYCDCAGQGIGVQHILYDPAEVARLSALVADGRVLAEELSVLFVVGQYPDGGEIPPLRLGEFLAALTVPHAEWMACAFGPQETRVLAAAMGLGGHARVGFENSLHRADGTIARDNAERVAEVDAVRAALGLLPGDPAPVLGRLR